MRLILDTHSFLWFIAGDEQLSNTGRELILDPDNDVFVSTASLWEMAIKISLGRLVLAEPFAELIPMQLMRNGFQMMPISLSALSHLTTLPFHHRDPFDRLIIAQAVTGNCAIVGKDALFSAYDVNCLW